MLGRQRVVVALLGGPVGWERGGRSGGSAPPFPCEVRGEVTQHRCWGVPERPPPLKTRRRSVEVDTLVVSLIGPLRGLWVPSCLYKVCCGRGEPLGSSDQLR